MPFYDFGGGERRPAFLTFGAAVWALAALIAGAAAPAGWWHGGQGWPAGGRGWAVASVHLAGAVALAGLANGLLSGWLGSLWLGRRHRAALRVLLARRRERWAAHDAAASAGSPEERLRHTVLRNRVALARPESATWMGDRLLALETRVFNEYGLDFLSAWPRLWLVVPESCRAELRSASASWRRATCWGAWALLYGVLAVVWWPLVLLMGVTLLWAVRSARGAVEAATDLAEAVVDLYAKDLAAELGIAAPDGRVDPSVGRLITMRLRKGV
ncbi:hypothetical protein [Streptomyces sp. IBSBF 2435]|uniref:hypothetical protein n=1 Tax=Streptomyces sp. IBSBF 2435 TaxID=2903531 RepID=UPI002FDC79A2